MYNHISQMEPLYPARNEALEDLAREVVAASAKLEGRLAPETLEGVRRLLRVVNSYYSNLIEGHSTHPVDIERAMRQDYSADQEKRDLQIESRIHIEVQEKMAGRLRRESDLNVASPEFLLWVHERFYSRLPERLRWVRGDDGKRAYVEAGRFRARFVKVGRHVPPAHESLDRFLERFAFFYDPAKQHGVRPLIALAAAHHRLMWIHPFLDGNGRVARLFTDAYFLRGGIGGYGLWNVSRGLARGRDSYRAHLAAGDAPREGDLDGRGNLSDRTLTEFCAFFLRVCLDQARYMDGLLALNGLIGRLEGYVQLREKGVALGPEGVAAPLRPEVAAVLRSAAVEGEIARGEVARLIGMSERTGRDVLRGLLDEGLLVATSEKGPVRLGFPAHAAGYLFPCLYPTEGHTGQTDVAARVMDEDRKALRKLTE
jgi:Fic family protein